MLEIKNLFVEYPDKTRVINDFTLTVNDGESVALVGANGAGKTSLIMALVGIVPSVGIVAAEGVTLSKDTENDIRQKIGVVFQNPDDQLFMPTIYDDVAFGPRNMGLDEDTVEKRVNDSLSLLNISHLAQKTPLKMSGGEKRMAAIATVLAMRSPIMLMDEPTAYLDPRARRNLIRTVKSFPHTRLIATHDLLFAAETCERTVLIKDGAVLADGKSRSLLYDELLMEKCGVEAIGIYERTSKNDS